MANPNYDGVMDLYNQLKRAGHEDKAKAVMDKIASKYPHGTNAPPEEIKKGLESIVDSSPSSHGKGAHANPQKPAQNIGNLAKAAMIVGGLALFAYTGIPIIP